MPEKLLHQEVRNYQPLTSSDRLQLIMESFVLMYLLERSLILARC
ncbi:MAG: hypothetical protein AB1861_28645 [Cyanobacteriota bacterium]